MPNILYRNDFWESVKDICLVYKFDDIKVTSLIKIFKQTKSKNELLPTQYFPSDKKSGKTTKGDIFNPYYLNDIYHCHFGIKANGDPLLVYRIINSDIKLVCLTTHHEMFNLKEKFVLKYGNDMPVREETEP